MAYTLTRQFTIKIKQAVGDSSGTVEHTFVCDTNKWYRAIAQIREGGAPFKNNADITIYGLNRERLNTLTYLLFNPITQLDKRNVLEIWYAQNLLFRGNTYFSMSDFSGAPDIAFRCVGAEAIFYDQELPPGGADLVIKGNAKIKADKVFKDLAAQMDYAYESAGISDIVCPDIILTGSLYERAYNLGYALGLNVDFRYTRMRVYPLGTAFENGLEYTISKDTGLIGYPSFNSNGVNFKALFDPRIEVGQNITLDSIVPQAAGTYFVNQKNTTLSTLPQGKWETDYTCYVNRPQKGL